MAFHGVLLLGVMANAYLFDPESRKGQLGLTGHRNTNPDKQRKFIN